MNDIESLVANIKTLKNGLTISKINLFIYFGCFVNINKLILAKRKMAGNIKLRNKTETKINPSMKLK